MKKSKNKLVAPVLKWVGGKCQSDCSEFLFRLIDHDGQPTVSSNPQYPQFLQTGENMTLAPLS